MIIPNRYLAIITLFFLSGITTFSQTTVINPAQKSRILTRDICFTKGGNTLAIASGSDIILYNMTDSSTTSVFNDGHKGDILSIDLSSDSSMIASGGKDSLVIIRSFTTGKILVKNDFHKAPVVTVKFSTIGNYVYSADLDGNIVFYSLDSDAVVYLKKIPAKHLASVDISQDGRKLAAGGSDGIIYIMNAQTGEIKGNSEKVRGWLREVAFSRDGSRLIGAGDNGRVTIYETGSEGKLNEIYSRRRSKGWINTASFGSENETYSLGSINGMIQVSIGNDIYRYDTKEPVMRVKLSTSKGYEIIVAAATLGKGVIIKKASEMELK